MSRWFRHYAGMMRDEKLVRAAVRAKQPVERVIWVWGAILESAAEVNDNGRYEFDTGEAAYFLRCDASDLDDVLDSLEHLGRLCAGMVAKWGDRQYTSDGAAERQRRYRERNKGRDGDAGQRDGDVQSRESDVTRDVTQTSRDGGVTAQETETETYQKEEPSGSSKKRGIRIPDDFEPDIEWALAQGLSLAETTFEAAQFLDYWRQQAGQRGVKLDWTLTWHVWVRNAIKRRRQQPRAGPNGQRMNAVEAFHSLQRLEHEHSSEAGDFRDAELLPPDKPGLPSPVVDLGKAFSRPFGSGNH